MPRIPYLPLDRELELFDEFLVQDLDGTKRGSIQQIVDLVEITSGDVVSQTVPFSRFDSEAGDVLAASPLKWVNYREYKFIPENNSQRNFNLYAISEDVVKGGNELTILFQDEEENSDFPVKTGGYMVLETESGDKHISEIESINYENKEITLVTSFTDYTKFGINNLGTSVLFYIGDLEYKGFILGEGGRGEEVVVQSDWDVTDVTSDAYIKNKPTSLSQFTNDLNIVTSWNELEDRPSFLTSTLPSTEGVYTLNVDAGSRIGWSEISIEQADWDETDIQSNAYIRNKPTALSDFTNDLSSGISDNDIVTIDSTNVNSGEYARFTDNGLEGRTPNELLQDIGDLSNLSGSSNVQYYRIKVQTNDDGTERTTNLTAAPWMESTFVHGTDTLNTIEYQTDGAPVYVTYDNTDLEPEEDDIVGRWIFSGNNANGVNNPVAYAEIHGQIKNTTVGSEEGSIYLDAVVNGQEGTELASFHRDTSRIKSALKIFNTTGDQERVLEIENSDGENLLLIRQDTVNDSDEVTESANADFTTPIHLYELTTTERDALVGPDRGWIIFNETTGTVQVYNGSDWEDVASEDGGEANVQSDWDNTVTTSDAYIQNKPAFLTTGLPSYDSDDPNAEYVLVPTSTGFNWSEVTDDTLTDAEVISALVNSTSITDANKSSIRDNIDVDKEGEITTVDSTPTQAKIWFGTQSDYDALDESDIDDNTLYHITDGNLEIPVATSTLVGGVKVGYTASGDNYPLLLDSNDRAYVNIDVGADNVQANWNETDNTSDAYIQNKPTNLSDFNNDLNLVVNAPDLGAGVLSDDVEVGNQNSTNGLKFWTGTTAQLPETRDDDTIYHVTDGSFVIPEATDDETGGFKTGFTESGNDYAVKINDSGEAFVTVDAGSTYTGGDGIDITGTVISIDLQDSNPGLDLDNNKLGLDYASSSYWTGEQTFAGGIILQDSITPDTAGAIYYNDTTDQFIAITADGSVDIGVDTVYTGGNGISIDSNNVIDIDLTSNSGLQFSSNALRLNRGSTNTWTAYQRFGFGLTLNGTTQASVETTDGTIYYDTDDDTIYGRIDGSWVDLNLSDASNVGGGILGDDVEVGNQNSASGLKFWTGTTSQLPATRDANTLYHVTDVSVLGPAIEDNNGTPQLASNISAAEIRNLIGAGDSSFDGSWADLDDRPTFLTTGLPTDTTKQYALQPGADSTWTWVEDDGGSDITVTSTSVSDGTNTFNKATLSSLGTEAFDSDGTYASLRAQGTTKADVGLSNVNNTAITVTTSSVSDGTNTFNKFSGNAADINDGVLGDGVEVGNQNSTNGLKFWTGTTSELPETRDSNTFYHVTDGSTSIAAATDTVVGGIKTGYTQTGNNYPVDLDSNDQAFVTVDTGDGNVQSDWDETDADSDAYILNKPTTITTAQADAITANTAKVSFDWDYDYGDLINTPTTITTAQADAITANTAKVGITTAQSDAITANTAKVGITSAEQTKLGYISVTQAVDLDALESQTVSNNAKVSATQANVQTALGISDSGSSNKFLNEEGSFVELDSVSIDAPDLGGGVLADDVEIGNQNASTGLKLWTGTTSQLPETRDADTLYHVTDGEYDVPVATPSKIGGIKTGYTDNGRNYAVELDANDEAYVNVPWTDNNTQLSNAEVLDALSADLDTQLSASEKTQARLNIGAGTASNASDVGLGSVTNESKSTMFASPTFTGTVTMPGSVTFGTITQDTSETTGLFVNSSNQLRYRNFGSNAFTSTTIPTNNNQLTNGAGYITSADGGDAGTLDGLDSTVFYRQSTISNASVGGDSQWVTVAHSSGARTHGEVFVSDGESSDHSFIRIDWMRSYQDSVFTVINCGGHSNRITGVRVLEESSDATYGSKYLQVQVTVSSNYYVKVNKLGNVAFYNAPEAVTPVVENTKTGYVAEGNTLTELDDYNFSSQQGIRAGGDVFVGGRLNITTTDDNTTSTTALVKNGTEIEQRTLGSLAFLSSLAASALTGGTLDTDVEIGNQRSGGNGIKMWTGTQTQYDAISAANIDDDTMYVVLPDPD